MELVELEGILTACDRKIAEGVKINREAIRILLANNSERRINKEKAIALFYVLSPFILFGIVVISNFQFRFNTNFYIGISLFSLIYSVFYFFDLRYCILLCRINFSEPILSIKRQIKELEKLKLKMNRIRYIFMPIAIFGILLMILPKVAFTMEFIVMIILIGVIFVGSLYYTRHSICERYNTLKRDIEELEFLEKEANEHDEFLF